MDHENLHDFIAILPQAALVIGRDERIIAINPEARRILGAVPEGRSYVTVLRQPDFGFAMDQALRGVRPERVRLRLSPRGESASVQMVTLVPLPHPLPPWAGGVLISFEDVTALESAEAMRRDFVANVSHELRTPLTALMGFIETLRSSARDDPKARDRFLSIMEREASRMNRLVGDLLSLSRVEGEERRRPTTNVDMSVLLRGVLQTLEHTAQSSNVALIREGETGEIRVPGDPDQLTQVFTNLIENAIKYGGQGGEVRVSLSRIAQEPVLGAPAVRVDVLDLGEGIDPVHLPRLTERFYRVDTHRSREKGGTGLGLAIVKHIVARHRGRLRVESTPGEGSRFTIILPLN
ncbi:two-component sensor histidine kinase [Thioclava sp. BHET1]|uniref:histidine kinase n=1 Tax=Thioclava dalianensis TaxID=1185766 RepID=A0A074TRC8_9RHOB|nr:ATP-binding protein [Thioclava dalianensis]KEP71528.1 ATPase [Thioclava dalianensis]TMV92933.1 two-component sensor histidine kinase [Thioclava sp. BHET1]SFN45450.1 two-component system, OmpR family, phosphate regulon sensor histidine kinase PhoR [Thioclava dalianensis]